jgi:hypothetical protein
MAVLISIFIRVVMVRGFCAGGNKEPPTFSALRGAVGGITCPRPAQLKISTMMIMPKPRPLTQILTLVPILLAGIGCQSIFDSEGGFEPIFDGRTLKGWVLNNPRGAGYGVTNVVVDGVTNAAIFCAKGGGGNLLTEKEYGDFKLRFDFRLRHGSNNGLAFRSPMIGSSLAYVGNELQILDGVGYEQAHNATLRPSQFHGSLYGVAPAKRGALKPNGQWNHQEVTVIGRTVKVVLNRKTILDIDINDINDPKTLQRHPGLLRDRGHIGFLGHNDYLELANIRIKEYPRAIVNNSPPPGFRALFNGRNLNGWQGLMKGPNNNPLKRAALTPAQRRAAQAEADANMTAHWQVIDDAIAFDGNGRSLQTDRDYRDYELLVDWKILDKGDSGIYLRGTPQVQIWDTRISENTAVGSGGLFNNKDPKNPSVPIEKADHLAGSWNSFRILMIQDKVHVFLNGKLVVNNTVLENYWDREQPLIRTGPIELQNHGNNLWFRNIYIREINTHADPKPTKKTPAP